MSYAVQKDSSRRLTGLVAVIAFHVVLVDANTCEKPAYPPASVRANEVGLVRLSFLIDMDGKVLDSKVERSSGHRRLDEAARAGLSLCKFRPATVNGKPERSWGRIEYVWKVELC